MVFDLRHVQQTKQLGLASYFLLPFSYLVLPGGIWLWTETSSVSPWTRESEVLGHAIVPKDFTKVS